MDVSVLTRYENEQISERQPLPERYLRLTPEEMDRRITAAKATLGSRLLILGHHYQRDEVIKFADFTGDSLKLSRQCAARSEADYVVFCGVHFMAESADILRGPHQKVILPDLAAGCSMADMADEDQLEVTWRELAGMGVDVSTLVPVTYINSSAAIKAFVGKHGGVVCTSTNAAAVMTWAWTQGEKLLMLPDQHLGRNTATRSACRSTGCTCGIPTRSTAVSRPTRRAARSCSCGRDTVPVSYTHLTLPTNREV